ncbi:hypothetical protein LRAMOSA05738 [Lichtheimia ramosa]|uniref:Rab family, other n=1 Tax=Lichtheimia ramosa TaxID=688394 RepID=A0A077X3I6_9FUNG|nr:hypothetical protein LRAMOSA05738 [Lichtheimia ramosa]
MSSENESSSNTTRPIVQSNVQPTGKATNVKLVLLGESGVGKSSLVHRFVNRDYEANREPTIGAAFLTQRCHLEDRVIKFEIWDTAGQERFHSLAPMYYRNAQAAIIVYDVTKASTLEKAKSWVKELQRQANSSIVIALAGNKLDLVESEGEEDDDSDENERQVPEEDARAYADEAGLVFMETSAKTSKNVDVMFTEIAKKIPHEHLISANRNDGRGMRGAHGNVDLMQPASENRSSSQCAC